MEGRIRASAMDGTSTTADRLMRVASEAEFFRQLKEEHHPHPLDSPHPRGSPFGPAPLFAINPVDRSRDLLPPAGEGKVQIRSIYGPNQ